MIDLFEDLSPGGSEVAEATEGLLGVKPLAARMRPRSLDEIVGQEELLSPGCLLRRAIEADRLNSILLYGPPGTGKTSLAEVIAIVTNKVFERTSGVLANVSILRGIIAKAEHRLKLKDTRTILFIDEIHRFNKAQQDILLPHVEDGTLTLIGATTHNPAVFINNALTSRSLVFELKPLSVDAIVSLLRRALESDRGLSDVNVDADDEALKHLAHICEGDARRALNAMELGVLTTAPDKKDVVRFTMDVAEGSIQKKLIRYDKDEDGHYDTISAFIKSVRGSDPDAAVYWLAKMLTAGEDPRFIARRLIILASEDIGNADPRGLNLAVSAMQAVEFIGMPEARIVLSQVTAYLATAPKSNASYQAIDKAMKDIGKGRVLDVPEPLKNVKPDTVGGNKDKYIYPHNYADHYVAQEYVPVSTRYYEPDGEGYEDVILKRLQRWREMKTDKDSKLE